MSMNSTMRRNGEIMEASWIQVLTIVGSVIIPMMAGFAWMISRMDNGFAKIDQRFDKIEDRLDSHGERLARIEGYLSGRDVSRRAGGER